MPFGQIWALIITIAAVLSFAIGFLLGPIRERHAGWLKLVSSALAAPWVLFVVLFGAYVIAAGNPQNTDRPGECCSAAQGWMLGAVVLGIPTLAALALFWAGVGCGWMLRSRAPSMK